MFSDSVDRLRKQYTTTILKHLPQKPRNKALTLNCFKISTPLFTSSPTHLAIYENNC